MYVVITRMHGIVKFTFGNKFIKKKAGSACLASFSSPPPSFHLCFLFTCAARGWKTREAGSGVSFRGFRTTSSWKRLFVYSPSRRCAASWIPRGQNKSGLFGALIPPFISSVFESDRRALISDFSRNPRGRRRQPRGTNCGQNCNVIHGTVHEKQPIDGSVG